MTYLIIEAVYSVSLLLTLNTRIFMRKRAVGLTTGSNMSQTPLRFANSSAVYLAPFTAAPSPTALTRSETGLVTTSQLASAIAEADLGNNAPESIELPSNTVDCDKRIGA